MNCSRTIVWPTATITANVLDSLSFYPLHTLRVSICRTGIINRELSTTLISLLEKLI